MKPTLTPGTRTKRPGRYPPSLERLESRLPPGDAVFGILLWAPGLPGDPVPDLGLKDADLLATADATFAFTATVGGKATRLPIRESTTLAETASAPLQERPQQTGRLAWSGPHALWARGSAGGREARARSLYVGPEEQSAPAFVAMRPDEGVAPAVPVLGPGGGFVGGALPVVAQGVELASAMGRLPGGGGAGTAGVGRAWAARYEGGGHDEARDLAVDAAGNVYVTGVSAGENTRNDYLTVKYSPDGQELWARRFGGPGDDEARALAVDAAGIVYVTGSVWFEDTAEDYVTLKYDTKGNLLWQPRRYDAVGNNDHAVDLAVDAAGNVSVTGDSVGEFNAVNYATVQYDAAGTEAWVRRSNGPANWDQATALAVDGAGNVYVTGWSWGENTGPDFLTLSYDTQGEPRWEDRYNGPGFGIDQASALAVDSAGNVYVAGQSWGIDTGWDYATLKYHSNGRRFWVGDVRHYDGPLHSTDTANALAVDAAGNVYVTGYSWVAGSIDTDYTTIKYDAIGTERWVRRFSGINQGDPDGATAIAVGADGNVYATGASWGLDTGFDYVSVKYDAIDGRQRWAIRYNGPDMDEAAAIAVDAAGRVYVTGRSVGVGTGWDYATIKHG